MDLPSHRINYIYSNRMKRTNYKSTVNNTFTSVKLHIITLFGFHLLRMVPYMTDTWCFEYIQICKLRIR